MFNLKRSPHGNADFRTGRTKSLKMWQMGYQDSGAKLREEKGE